MRRTELSAAARLCAQYLDRERKVLCAVSGGLDSMCLLHYLRAQGYDVACAHFDHQLRGEDSARDAQFVRDWCAANGIPFYHGSGDVRAYAREAGESIEAAARTLRYRFLRQTAAALDAQLVTAHHQDDNAETVLLHLIRGADLQGLRGMLPMQGGICRPFLDVTRAELADYAAAHGIPHVEDATNADPTAAARNYLRHEIMPRLQSINPRAGEHIAAGARSLALLDGEVEEAADALLTNAVRGEDTITLPRALLRAARESVRVRALLRMADALGVGRRDITRAQLKAACALLDADDRAVRTISLPRGARLEVADDLVALRRAALRADATLAMQTPVRWGHYTLTLLPTPSGEGLSLRAEEARALRVSHCDAGAYLRLPGTNGARSVKRLCIDAGIPLRVRETLPALYSGDRLAAVWGLGVDEAFVPRAGERTCFVRIGELRRADNQN